MGEDFQAEVCSSTWWNSPRGSIGFSPFLVGMNDFGSYGWPSHDLVEMKARSTDTRDVPNLIYGQGPILFDQNLEKLSEGPLIDSTSQMMDISRSSTITTTDWSQNLISGSGCNEHNYQSPMMQENMSSQGFSLHSSLPMSSSPSYVYPSITMIENLFVDDQLPLENQPINISSTMNYRTNLNEISRSLSKLPTLLTPLQNQQEVSPLQLAKNTPFWNASISTSSHDMSVSIFPSSKAPTVEKPNPLNLKTKSNSGTVQDSKKNNAEPALKRPRIETPSSLPTFKVRKEKLGDRITALQQLVSPFGKTDTASVLQEALEYIRFLHDQVNALSTPYKKNGAPIQQQQNNDNSKDSEGPKQDLRRRGLCLVPISSTFPIANETTVDFWTPTFGGAYR